MNERRVLDTLFGVYAAILLVPAGVLSGWEAGAAELPVTVFVGIGVVIAALGTGVARTVDDLVERVVSPLAVALIIGLPLLYVLSMIVAEAGSATEIISVVGLSALLPGIGILVGGTTVRNRRLRETATEIAVVTVGEDGDDSTRNRLVMSVMLLSGLSIMVGGMLLLLGTDGNTATLLSTLGGLGTSASFFVDDSSEIVVTDVGLRVDPAVLYWDDLDGYRVTDEAVEIVHPNWYQPTKEFDREEISDDDALIEGLEQFLPRLDKHGRVELAAR